MAKPIKVLVTIPILYVGGTELQTLNLIKVLIAAGFHVDVCCYYDYHVSMTNRFENAGANVILMKLDRSAGLIHLTLELLRLYKYVKPDIIHVQYVTPGLIPIIVARFARIENIFATVHQPGTPYGYKEKIILRIAARLCRVFICNSKAVEESWFGNSELFNAARPNTHRRHFTIYNAIDTELISSIVENSKRDVLRGSMGLSGTQIIGMVGRLRWEKGQSVLLDAFKEVLETMSDVKLLIVGDGPDREMLNIKIEKLGISDNVIWLGRKEPEEVYYLYSIMDIVAVPSWFEGFGLTAAEAMAARLPVIGSRVDGLPEVIEDGASGYLVSPGDKRAVAKAMIDLLGNPNRSKKFGQTGYKRVQQLFSFRRYSEAILAVYDQFQHMN